MIHLFLGMFGFALVCIAVVAVVCYHRMLDAEDAALAWKTRYEYARDGKRPAGISESGLGSHAADLEELRTVQDLLRECDAELALTRQRLASSQDAEERTADRFIRLKFAKRACFKTPAEHAVLDACAHALKRLGDDPPYYELGMTGEYWGVLHTPEVLMALNAYTAELALKR